MKLSTHDHTPKPHNRTRITGLFILCGILSFGIFGLLSLACFYYARSITGGILGILIPLLLTAMILLHINDMEKAYIEISEKEIFVVDYYWGIKKEKHFTFSDITSAEIHSGYSRKVRGYRHSTAGMRYIVFSNGDTYLFKIIALPETEEIFKEYIG